VISVLYIDNDQILLEAGKRYMERDDDIRVDTAPSFSEALQLLNTTAFDAVIADCRTKEIDGIQLLKVLREKYPKIPRIIFTYGDMKKDFNQVIQHGADYYIRKNGDPKSQFAELSHIV